MKTKRKMTTLLSLALSLLFVLQISIPVMGAEDPPTNLVVNPGFEDGGTGWRYSSGAVTITSPSHSGTKAAFMGGLANGRWLMTDEITPSLIDPARTYRLSVWMKISATLPESTVNLKFGASEYASATIYSGFSTADCFTVIPVKDLTTAYQQFEFTFTGAQLLSNSPTNLMAGLVADGGWTGTPYVYFDDFELIAEPIASEYTITASTPDNRGTITGNTSVLPGGSSTMTITPNSHCEIADVKVNGVSQGAISSYTFVNVTENQTIEATFNVLDENLIDNPGFEDDLTAWAPWASGALGSTASSAHSGSGYYYISQFTTNRRLITAAPGISPSLIDPARTYSLSVWIKASAPMTESLANIKFGAAPYYATPSYSGFGTANCFTVIPVKDITTTYQKYEVTFTGAQLLTGNPSNLMVGMVFDVDDLAGPPYVYFDDFDLIAVPIAGDYTITVSTPDNRGTITGNTSVAEGGSTTVTITPLSHCKIDDVKVNGVSQGAISSYTFENVTADQTIVATFSVLTENLINNFGFEDGGTGWRYSSGAVTITSTSHSGTKAAYMGGLASGRWLMTDEIKAALIDPARDYRISFWVRINPAQANTTDSNLKFGASAYSSSTIYNGFGANDCFIEIPTNTLTTTYQKFEFTCSGAQLLAGNPSDLMVGVVADEELGIRVGGDTQPFVYFDDFELMDNVPTFNMSIEHNYGGSIQGNTAIPQGSDVTYTFHPLAGYNIYDVIVDGVSAGDVDHVSFENVQKAHTIKVIFTKPAKAYTHIDFEEQYTLQQSTRMEIVTGEGYDGQSTGMLHVPSGDYDSAVFLNWSTVTAYSDPVFTIPVKPSTTYIWSARYKFSSDTTTSYFVFYVDYASTLLSRVIYADIEKDVWLQNEMYITTGPNQTSISTTFNAGNYPGEFWIDDIELKEIPTGVMEATDLSYCEDIFNVITPSEIKAQGSGSFILKLPVTAGVRYTFGATVSYTKTSDSYIALASDAAGTLMNASIAGAPSAKIIPEGIGTEQRSGYVFMSDSSGYVYLVVSNDDGALDYKDLHLFQTYSSVTGVEMGYEEDPNDRDPEDPEDPGDSPETGIPATWPYTIIFTASMLTVIAFIKKRRVKQ